LKRHGKIFISYSASATDHNYCIGLLSVDETANLLDPASWQKHPAPIFRTCESSKRYGPGHNSFTIAEDGKTDLMIYHARPYRDVKPNALQDPNRHTMAIAFTWNSDHLPNFDPAGAGKTAE
jgi:GH43 family beta-xylosidase